MDALSQLHALAAQLDLNGLLRMVTHSTGSISVDPHLGFRFELAALQTKVASHAPASMRACLRCTVSTRACTHPASAAYCSDRGAVHEMVPTHVTVTSQIVVRGHTAPTTHGLQHTTYSNRHKAWNAQHTARDLHRIAGNIQHR